MRTLLISVLATTLIGCGCLTPPRVAMNECTDEIGFGCFNGTVASPQIDPKPAAIKTDPVKKNVKTKIATKRENPSSAQVGDKADPASKNLKSTIAPKPEEPSSAQVGAKADPVLQKAKSTIAAKMEDASAEFSEMKRAVRKNTLGKSVDTICGYVKGRDPSGGDTGERPFLYLVQEDEAYIVDGTRDMIAAAAYRNICN